MRALSPAPPLAHSPPPVSSCLPSPQQERRAGLQGVQDAAGHVRPARAALGAADGSAGEEEILGAEVLGHFVGCA